MQSDTIQTPPGFAATLSLAGLVVLGDLLFWGAPIGLSAVVFAWATFGATALMERRWNTRAALILIAGSLPMLEHAQPLSLVILLAGLSASIAWLTRPERASPTALATRIAASVPRAAIRDLVRAMRAAPERLNGWSGARAWAFPLGGSLVLLALIVHANPILWTALLRFAEFDPDLPQLLGRALFWSGLAMLVWPLLTCRDARPFAPPARRLAVALPQGAVLRALVLFNLVLASQLGLDAMVLMGGALPDGMTYSDYARRGAFPLLAATMLGGAFALIARSHLGESPELRPLLFLWLAQNIVMTATAGYRLAMYVEAYGLTYLRLYAAIWMGMVVILLAMTALQIARDLPARWLVIRAVCLGLVVLYASAFVNYADLIARQNIARGGDIDTQYLRFDLPMTAWATVCAELSCPRYYSDRLAVEDWREWGFRRWRVDRRMDAL